jgi:hypothetical protein
MNSATSITGITTTGAVGFQATSSLPAIAPNAAGVGLVGFVTVDGGVGTKGLANNGIGVQGGIGALGTTVTAANTLAVQGVNFANATGSTGVQGNIAGTSDGTIGMEGLNAGIGAHRIGVLGTIDPTDAGLTSTAVVGLNLSTGVTSSGVQGTSNGSNGGGVVGSNSSTGVGVQGQSQSGHGLVGTTSATDGQHAALIGSVQPGGNAVALRGSIPAGAGGFAGVFDGPVIVNGSFQVFGAPKNAAVKHPGDGTYRLLYCMESPESWFEDFGKAKLAGGKVDVKLDPDFVAVSLMDDYHVFLNPYGDTSGLYVTNQTPSGFTVQEHNGGTGNVSFSWRLVAKRKDIKGERLAKTTPAPAPKFPAPIDVTVPERYQKPYQEGLGKKKA